MKRSFTRPRGLALLLATTALIFAIGFWGCSTNDTPVSPNLYTGPTMSVDNPQFKAAMAVQDLHTAELMADKDVIGTATTVDEAGNPAILVLATTQKAIDAIPKTLDGYAVQTMLTDKIVAMKSTAVSHKAKQTPPIQLGTSGGWRYDLANGYCCGGTLGSSVVIGGSKYVLSNYHVLEADIVSGGNGRVATTGDYIIQPGLIDVGCNAASAQNVATLVVKHSLPNNNVDCAVGQFISGMVADNGAILEVGTIGATTVAATVGQAVKKSGRTTGLTRSSVSGLNATVSVQYENECAGGVAFTKTFTGQILVKNTGSRFLNSGDSGSLMVQDVTTNPKAVGLLFAGSSSIAVANPIGQVLSFLGASMNGI